MMQVFREPNSPGQGHRAREMHLHREAPSLPARLLPCRPGGLDHSPASVLPTGGGFGAETAPHGHKRSFQGACKEPDSYSTCRLGGVDFWDQGVEGLVQGGHSHTSPDAAAPREWNRGSSLCRVVDMMSARSSVRRNCMYEDLYSLSKHLLNACALFPLVTTNAASRGARPHTQRPRAAGPSQLQPPAPHLHHLRHSETGSLTHSRQRKEKTRSYFFHSSFLKLSQSRGYALGKRKNANDWRRPPPIS